MKIGFVLAKPGEAEDDVADETEGVDGGNGINGGDALEDGKDKNEENCDEVEGEKFGVGASEAGDVEELSKAEAVNAGDLPIGPD